jgi:thymidylate synthase ThyX
MTTITAKVIADSISPQNIRLTTLQLRYPRCIHSEFMTHRVFSRNASSSRAIPVKRLTQDVIDDPYIPVHWGKNQPGMQAREECTRFIYSMQDDEYKSREEAWLHLHAKAIDIAVGFSDAGYHKQIVNRLLEPWAHINVVCTSTEWSNFFALRDHEDAMPEIRMLAQAMKKAMAESTPTPRKPGEWHLPYVGELKEDKNFAHLDPDNRYLKQAWDQAIKISVARCARVSYLTQEGKKPNIEEDLALYERLVSAVPPHMSPCEHQATPDNFERTWVEAMGNGWHKPELHGNFNGWCQYRKSLENRSD